MNRTVLIGVSAIAFVLLCVCLPVTAFAGLAVTGQLNGLTAKNATATRTPTAPSATNTPARSASTATPARTNTTATPARSGPTATPARTTPTPARTTGSPTPARPAANDPLNATGVGDTFMRALRDFDDDAAFALFHPGLQSKYDDAAEFGDLVTDNDVRPKTWKEWTLSSSSNGGDPTTVVKTDVTFQDGKPGTAEFEVISYQGRSRIIRFNLTH